MSERSDHGPSDPAPSAKDNTSHGAPGERGASPSDRPTLFRSISDQSQPASSPDPRRSENTGRSFELPPLPPPSNIASGSFSTPVTRVGGVSSILNPVQAEEPQAGRRRKASYLESPASSTQSLPPIVRPPQSPAGQHAIPGDRAPRRILTPRSPSLHRAASVGQLNPSTGTINAQTNPFPSSFRGRTYTVEPGTSGAPPLPTPPAVTRPSYGFPAPTPTTAVTRRASIGNGPPAAPSASASPTTSYSSYSQGYTSPAAQYEPSMMTSAPSGFAPGDHGPLSSNTREHQRQLGIPISSSGGQSVYQMLTLETTSGTVQLPVDVQAASRVADEKRRRNAGASARFRQRRKEKEKEAATSISRLEQQVKELAEESAFYRNERDNLSHILRHMPGGERHFPRPPSPRHRRTSGGALSGGPEGIGYQTGHEHISRSPEQGRNVRRRTSTYSLPPPPQQPPPSMPPPPSITAQQGFAPPPAHHAPPSVMQPASGPLPSPHGRGPLPPAPGPASTHVQSLQQHPHGPPAVLQTLPQPGPYNPYAPDRRSSGPQSQQRDGQ